MNHELESRRSKTIRMTSIIRPKGLVLALIILFTIAFSFYQIKSVYGITVGPSGPPDYDYKHIQDAVDHATAGATIYVTAGTYYEHVYVNKSLTITGNSPQTTIVDGTANGTVFDLDGTHITITGFTIRNAGSIENGVNIARELASNDFNSISNNIITTSQYGIYLSLSNQNTISGNVISSNKYGIYISVANLNTISSNNIISSNQYGINISGANQNIISGNTIVDNPLAGIQMASDNNEQITGNTIKQSAYAIKGVGSLNNIITGNTLSQTSYAIHLTSASTGNTIRSNIISGKTNGIYVNSDSSTIEYNIITNCSVGIYLYNCKTSTIRHNTMQDNSYAIRLYHTAATTASHTITNNKILSSDWAIDMTYSNGNTFWGNWIQGNTYGIYMTYCGSNIIYRNNFISNAVQGYSGIYANSWDYNGNGNHWSDHTTPDADGNGIVDTTYLINPSGIDHSPLRYTWSEHDVAVTSVSASKNEVNPGEAVTITVKARNNDNITASETFQVTVKYNNTIIGTQQVTNLNQGATSILTYNWNTTGVAPGNYTIKAEATTVTDELNTDNNSLNDGTVEIKAFLSGDINHDGVVNAQDLTLLNQAFGSTLGSSNWNANADFNKDNKVDALDLDLLGRNWGKTG